MFPLLGGRPANASYVGRALFSVAPGRHLRAAQYFILRSTDFQRPFSTTARKTASEPRWRSALNVTGGPPTPPTRAFILSQALRKLSVFTYFPPLFSATQTAAPNSAPERAGEKSA